METNFEEFLKNYQYQGDGLPIHTYPDPVLTKKAMPVTEFNSDLAKLAQNMLFTMYQAPGIGLAAPQIGKSIRLFVVDVEYDLNKELNSEGEEVFKPSSFVPRVFVNPEIIKAEGFSIYQEGCLSLPEIYEEVERPETITLKYQDLNGNFHELEASGMLATCIQHENDHLDGIVFIDHLSLIKKNLIKNKLTKKKKKKKNS